MLTQPFHTLWKAWAFSNGQIQSFSPIKLWAKSNVISSELPNPWCRDSWFFPLPLITQCRVQSHWEIPFVLRNGPPGLGHSNHPGNQTAATPFSSTSWLPRVAILVVLLSKSPVLESICVYLPLLSHQAAKGPHPWGMRREVTGL